MLKGKCLTPVTHPESGELVEKGADITIADQAQFDSLVEIGAIKPAKETTTTVGTNVTVTPLV
jgi:hypothetical protein